MALVFAQAVVSVPAYSPPADLASPADPSRLTLVIADTVSETDPQKLCARADCTSLFLGRYRVARVIAGPPLPDTFAARVEMGSPWNRSYRLALIVEQREGREALVRAVAGFNTQTNEACFETRDTDRLHWSPQGEGVTNARGEICVREPGR